MTESQFEFHMRRLIDTFGKAAYGGERLKLIWAAVGSLEESWLRSVVNEFIGTSRHAPILTEFREAVSRERERLWESAKMAGVDDSLRASNVIACRLCDDSGLRWRSNAEGYQFVSRCKCVNGQRQGHAIPETRAS